MPESEAKALPEFEPFQSVYLRRRDEIVRLVNTAGYALNTMKGLPHLAKALRHSDEEVARTIEIEAQALGEAKSDFPQLHGAATVLIWSALEVAVRDFLILWLTFRPSARTVPELNHVRVRVAEYEALTGEDRMRYLVGALERERGAALKPGAGRFECLLHPFGINPTVEDSTRRDLSELAAVRNVIVHRAGIADSRFVDLCPWMGKSGGDPVTVGREAFYRYVTAASHFAGAIVESAEQSTTPRAT